MFAPVSVRVPVPALVRLPAPLIAPLYVVLLPFPPAVKAKLPKLIPPLPAIDPNVLSAPSCNKAPVLTVKAVLLGRLPLNSNVPPPTVVAPWYVFAPDSVKLP